MRRLYNIVRMQRKSVQSESLDFFQYVTDKIAKPTVTGPFERGMALLNAFGFL